MHLVEMELHFFMRVVFSVFFPPGGSEVSQGQMETQAGEDATAMDITQTLQLLANASANIATQPVIKETPRSKLKNGFFCLIAASLLSLQQSELVCGVVKMAVVVIGS